MTAWITAFTFPELPVLLCASWGTAHIRLQQQLATSLLYHTSKTSVMWHHVTCMKIVNCFQKCGFHSNQIGHVEDASKLCIAKDVWSHPNIISRICILWWWWWWWWCNRWHADLGKNDGQKFDIWKGGGVDGWQWWKSEPPALYMNYGQQWHCEEIPHHVWCQCKLLAALSSIESKVYTVQQKVQEQQLTFMGMWITISPQHTELDYIFNATSALIVRAIQHFMSLTLHSFKMVHSEMQRLGFKY